jgi:hypothetical protein
MVLIKKVQFANKVIVFNIWHFFAELRELICNESSTKDQFAIIGLKVFDCHFYRNKCATLLRF